MGLGYFLMVTHVVACIWIIIANMDNDVENSWITGYDKSNRSELYLTAFYFTVTTITTVGYGDMPISTKLEKIIVIFIMLAGVIGFAMASGALTNMISQSEAKSKMYEEKMSVLDKLQNDHVMEHDLYKNIKKHIEYNDIEEVTAIGTFVEDLPLELRKPLTTLIYKEMIATVDFLKDKRERFINWISPTFKLRVVAPRETIYYENDYMSEVFFLKSGSLDYVLPKYENQPFLKIVEHTTFGLIDFVAALLSRTQTKNGIMSVFEENKNKLDANTGE